MNIVFRVDASTRMGVGHLMRCLTLAEALRERGLQTRFICREHSGHLIGLLRQKAMLITVLPSPQISTHEAHCEDYSNWLGVTQSEDAEQTIDALNGEKPDLLVVDHYGLDVKWEKQLRPHANKLMVIDDLANRQHDCDILLDQNYSAEAEQRYKALVPDGCKLLVGPRYALLRPEYAAYRKTLNVREKRVKRVFVFFGGTDPQNMTGLVLDTLSSSELNYLHVDVVVGANNPHNKDIEKQILHRPNTILHKPRSHLADLMAKADLAIGAGGVTTWERMCLGLPTVVISIAANQQPASEALGESQLIHYAGHFSEIKIDQLTQELQQLCIDFEKLKFLSTQSKLEVDGQGVLRIVEVLCPSADSEIRLRPACEEDVDFYFNWSKDLKVRKNENKSHHNTWSKHHSWFTNKLHDVKSRLFVLEVFGLPVGQIRFDKNKDEVSIDYSLDAIVRGRGWDSRLLAQGAELLQKIEPVRLIDKDEDKNKTTRSLFLRMGFTKSSNSSESCAYFSISILSDRTSWMNDYIRELQLEWLSMGHRVQWVHDKEDLGFGDFCFFLSCGQVVSGDILSRYRHNLVIHESDLPRGKGWSPLTWQILEGQNKIPVTLIEATEKIDSGVIYLQEWLEFEGHELISELREAQAIATLNLSKKFVDDYPKILDEATQQSGEESYYLRRREGDSQLYSEKSIEEQFELLRVVDNERYPAFFENREYRYMLKIEKVKKL